MAELRVPQATRSRFTSHPSANAPSQAPALVVQAKAGAALVPKAQQKSWVFEDAAWRRTDSGHTVAGERKNEHDREDTSSSVKQNAESDGDACEETFVGETRRPSGCQADTSERPDVSCPDQDLAARNCEQASRWPNAPNTGASSDLPVQQIVHETTQNGPSKAREPSKVLDGDASIHTEGSASDDGFAAGDRRPGAGAVRGLAGAFDLPQIDARDVVDLFLMTRSATVAGVSKVHLES